MQSMQGSLSSEVVSLHGKSRKEHHDKQPGGTKRI